MSHLTPAYLTFLDPQGPVAAAQRTHFLEVTALVAIVVLPVILLTPILAWRYRYANRSSRYSPHWGFSWLAESVVWGVPVAVVGVLIWLLVGNAHALDPYKVRAGDGPPLKVQVVGYDWKWLFIYPDQGIASVGTLAFPADRPLSMQLTSNTVMQSFFVPALGSQIYAMAGMVTQLNLEADRPGRFLGENTQYNGEGFQDEKFTAVAMTAQTFAAWVAQQRTNGVTLDAAARAALGKRSTKAQLAHQLGRPGETSLGFKDVPAGLFDAIVHQSVRAP